MGVLNYEVMWYISGHVSFTEVKSKLNYMAKGHVLSNRTTTFKAQKGPSLKEHSTFFGNKLILHLP